MTMMITKRMDVDARRISSLHEDGALYTRSVRIASSRGYKNRELTEMQGALLLDIVIRKSAAVLQLLTSEDQTLLVWRDTLLVLDLRLDVVDGVGRLDFEGDGLAGQSLDEDLHATTETKDYRAKTLRSMSAYMMVTMPHTKVESALLLNIIVGEGATVLELLASEDEALLVWGDTLLILNLGLNIVDGIRRFDFESDGLSGQSLYENLHTTTESEHY